MARITDLNKIEKVKKAAIDMIIKYGYKGASIASIAKKAGVSIGYLYRYYSSKEELIEDLVDTHLSQIKKDFMENFSKDKSFHEMIEDITLKLFELAQKDLLIAKFILVLVLEVSFNEESKKKSCDQFQVAQKIRQAGLKTKELNSRVTEEEIMVVIFTIPFMYLAKIIEKDNYKELLNEKVAKRVAQMCIQALK